MSGAGTDLEVRGLTVRHGPVVALDGFDLDVAAGEVLAVIGPSGSGKSTLLRAIAGLDVPAAGTIAAGGVDLASVPTHRRDLGLMFQDHALFPNRTVADNVAFGLEMRRWPAHRRSERVAELLDLVDLGSLADRPVSALSGGEAQRVALARALAPEPSLLMLDEPFGSLDRLLREELTIELRSLLTELGQTALHVTHDQPEAFALADRVAVLRQGRLEQIGRPDELWRAPASEFVADFVGHRSIWTVEVDREGTVSLGPMSLGVVDHLAPGRHRVVVPISSVAVVADRSPGTVAAEVVACAFDAGRYEIDARLAGEGRGERVAVRSGAPADVGSVIHLAIGLGDLHPLPPE